MQLNLLIPLQEVIMFTQVEVIEIIEPVEGGRYSHTRRINMHTAPRSIPLSQSQTSICQVDHIHHHKEHICFLFQVGTFLCLDISDECVVGYEIDVVCCIDQHEKCKNILHRHIKQNYAIHLYIDIKNYFYVKRELTMATFVMSKIWTRSTLRPCFSCLDLKAYKVKYVTTITLIDKIDILKP